MDDREEYGADDEEEPLDEEEEPEEDGVGKNDGGGGKNLPPKPPPPLPNPGSESNMPEFTAALSGRGESISSKACTTREAVQEAL